MPIFTADNRDAWQALADDCSKTRPSVGKRVRVTAGKLKGKEGLVTWHGVNKYHPGWRYCTDAQQHLRYLMGTIGYRVRIQPEDGMAVFVDAEKVEIINA